MTSSGLKEGLIMIDIWLLILTENHKIYFLELMLRLINRFNFERFTDFIFFQLVAFEDFFLLNKLLIILLKTTLKTIQPNVK